jgi:hypothetical protein
MAVLDLLIVVAIISIGRSGSFKEAQRSLKSALGIFDEAQRSNKSAFWIF